MESWHLGEVFLRNRIPSLATKIKELCQEDPDHNLDDPVTLRGVEPQVFALGLDWLLTGKLGCSLLRSGDNAANESNIGHFATWCALYVFAEDYELPDLSNATIERIKNCLSHAEWSPSTSEIKYVFKKTKEDCPLQKVVTKEVTKRFIRQSLPDFQEQVEEWTKVLSCHPEFHAKTINSLKIQFALTSRRLGAQRRGQPPKNRLPQDLSNEVIDLTG